MQVVKLKARLITAGIVLVSMALVALLFGTGILVSIIGGNESSSRSISLAGCHDSASTGGNTSDGHPDAPEDIAKEQDEIVRTIEKEVKSEGVDGRAVRIVAITGYGESTLMNLDYGDQDTAGTTNPDGSAATSYGFLQQQVSMGWGTKEQVTDPAYATRAFLNGAGGNKGLLDVPGWEDMEPTEAIHAVQKNADPMHYVRYYSDADKVIERTGVDTTFSGKTTKDGADADADSSKDGGDGSKISEGLCKKASSWDGDLGDGEWTTPCPGCEKASGYESRGINGVDKANGNFHYGVDLATPGAGYADGVEIIAPTDMKVVNFYRPDGCVFAVADSEPKFGFGFCHMNRIDVEQDQQLKRGDILGIEGNKGDSVGSLFITHLHFELYKPGADMNAWSQHKDNIDPEPILKEKGAWPQETPTLDKVSS